MVLVHVFVMSKHIWRICIYPYIQYIYTSVFVYTCHAWIQKAWKKAMQISMSSGSIGNMRSFWINDYWLANSCKTRAGWTFIGNCLLNQGLNLTTAWQLPFVLWKAHQKPCAPYRPDAAYPSVFQHRFFVGCLDLPSLKDLGSLMYRAAMYATPNRLGLSPIHSASLPRKSHPFRQVWKSSTTPDV